MGPAAAFKLIGQRYFSFTVFGFSQILMDLEPLIRILRGDAILHGFSHSYLGATLIGSVSLIFGKPICEYCLQQWNKRSSVKWLSVPTAISWGVAALSAYIGTLSHVLLDSMLHGDIRPWVPFTDDNVMLYWLSVRGLHLLCFALGGIGAVGLTVVWIRSNRTIDYN
jgi:hypothetical protein